MAGYGQRNRKDYTGMRFGALTALQDVGTTGKHRLWRVACDCGNVKVIAGHALYKLQSCGCLKNQLIGRSRTTHGMSKHPAYWVWRAMRDRCRLPTHQAWKNYGGRGITVCQEWATFLGFWTDMGPTYQRGLTLERTDNNAGYSKANCVWASATWQSRNQRSNRRITTPWGEMTVSEAAQLSGIGVTTLLYRITNGWRADEWFRPPDVRKKSTTSSIAVPATGSPSAGT